MSCSSHIPENDQKVACKKVYNKRYYAENKERILTRQKRYRTENAEILKTRRKRWYEINKERLRQQPESLLSTKQGTHLKLPKPIL